MLEPVLQGTAIRFQTLVEEGQIPMEPDLIKTVLLNLLDNGRKAMEGGGTLQLLGRFEQEKGREGFVLLCEGHRKGNAKGRAFPHYRGFLYGGQIQSQAAGRRGSGPCPLRGNCKTAQGTPKLSERGRQRDPRPGLAAAEEEKSCPGGPEHGTRRSKERDGEV